MKNEFMKSAEKENKCDANCDPIRGATGAHPPGLMKNEVAEKMDPAVEDAYWKANFSKQGYVRPHSHFVNYQAAYRAGYEGFTRYPGKSYEEMEPELQRSYENSKANALLGWDKARHAIRAAWHRLDNALPRPVAREELPARTRRGRLESLLD